MGNCKGCEYAFQRSARDIARNGNNWCVLECSYDDRIRYRKPDDGCDKFKERKP